MYCCATIHVLMIVLSVFIETKTISLIKQRNVLWILLSYSSTIGLHQTFVHLFLSPLQNRVEQFKLKGIGQHFVNFLYFLNMKLQPEAVSLA